MSDDPESDAKYPVRSFDKHRIEALIDGIFAVALTLLVLDIKLPEDVIYATNEALWQRLLALERHLTIYAITFLVIGIYWVAHHVQFHYVRYTDRRLLWINLLFLFLISFLPFATDLVGDHKQLVLPCMIYGLTLLATSGASYLHLRYLDRHAYLATPDLTPVIVRMLMRRIALFTVVPAVSMLIALFNTHLALYAYLLLACVHFLPARIDERIQPHVEPRRRSDDAEHP